MYIFWDNSNIHISGLNSVRPILEPEAPRELYRTNFRNLFQLVANNRKVDAAFLSGSVPPPSDDLWNYLRSMGIKLHLLDKTAEGKEQESVDMSLQAMMLRTVIDNIGNEPSTIAVLTGDGAGKQLGEGFLTDLKRIREKFNWEIEIYAWETTCSNALKQYAKENGRFVKLEDFYNNVTYIKKDRDGILSYWRASTGLS